VGMKLPLLRRMLVGVLGWGPMALDIPLASVTSGDEE